MIHGGKLTAKGLEELKTRMPYVPTFLGAFCLEPRRSRRSAASATVDMLVHLQGRGASSPACEAAGAPPRDEFALFRERLKDWAFVSTVIQAGVADHEEWIWIDKFLEFRER